MTEFYDGPLGTKIRKEFESPLTLNSMSSGRYRWAQENGPTGGEDYFEWSFLSKIIEGSKKRNKSLLIMEMGCGYGRWLVNAYVLAKKYGTKIDQLIGWEPSAKRLEMAEQHMLDNAVPAELYTLQQSAIGPVSGYGSITETDDFGAATEYAEQGVTMEKLGQMLDRYSPFWPEAYIYLSMDVQNIETEIFNDPDVVNDVRRVDFLHVACHSQAAHQAMLNVTSAAGYTTQNWIAMNSVVEGVIFLDGIHQIVRPM